MRMKRMSGLVAASLAAVLVLASCGGDSEGDDAPADVASDVELEGSPTFDAATERGTIRIGVKEDQPGLGYLDVVTEERTGFDIEIARWIAAELGFGEDDIEFQAIASANREQAIVNGDIDFYVGTYSITDSRKQDIDFAGPYFETGQGLLVAADNETITGPEDLAGVNVCSATGSTPIQNIRDNFPDTETTEFDTYTQCVEALKNGQVDAVTTDEAILLGYASLEPDVLQVVGEPFSTELYGVGLPKGDDVLRSFINDLFENDSDTWQQIYDDTLGASGTEVEQPAVDRY